MPERGRGQPESELAFERDPLVDMVDEFVRLDDGGVQRREQAVESSPVVARPELWFPFVRFQS